MVSNYKLAFAVDRYFEFGGMQRTLLRIARECAKRGHDVHIFTRKWEGQIPTDLTVHLLRVRALTNHALKKKFGDKIGEIIASRKFDCITGSTTVPGLDVYYGGDPCYVARANASRSRVYKMLPRYKGLRKLEGAVFAAAGNTEILLIAHEERDKFISHYGTDPKRFHLLPPGINRDRLVKNVPTSEARSDLRRDLGLTSDDWLLLHVGSWFARKGVDRMINALAALAPELRAKCKLVVVGDDNSKRFVKLAKRLGVGDSVVFLSVREQISAFYYAAELLIHPAYTENTGTTIIEAMVCGLPVLVTENCGFAFHVENARAGIVCPTPFHQATLNKMLADMLKSDRRLDWGRNGQKYCETSDLYSLVEKAADIVVTRAARNRSS